MSQLDVVCQGVYNLREDDMLNQMYQLSIMNLYLII